ncbi:BPL-N domain-containing protein [Bremerella cremea]|uniref:BPL-N domain-containing protein n=1 Tax=Bremerella cremea TaxID=1031537 RepID=UPI0031EEE56D
MKAFQPLPPTRLFVQRFVSGLFLTLLAALPAMAETNSGGASPSLVRVAIYDHSGGSAAGPKNLQTFLVPKNGFESKVVTPQQIRDGVLDEFDVLIMPGGSGSAQAKNLEDEGREIIRKYVDNGGGYVGICAGSYLASSHYSWSLGLINAKVWDRSHWARGTGTVSLELSSTGSDLLKSDKDSVPCYYGQGPLLVPNNDPSLPGYEVLATYGTEIAEKGAPEGAMTGTHAIVRSMFGAGRVICYSPHPEKTGGPNSIMAEGVRWAGTGKAK